MENINDKKEKKNDFFPYKDNTKKIYFIYAAIFLFFNLVVFISSLFIIINLAVNSHLKITSDKNTINIIVTPFLNIVLTFISLGLLLFAPWRIHHSPKQSSIMFYCSFWALVVSTLLNSQVQLTYNSMYWNSSFYHWIDNGVLVVLVTLFALALFVIEIFFWIMRRKFAFMPTDYEIYTTRSKNKKIKKAEKKRVKAIKKAEKKEMKLQKSRVLTETRALKVS